MKAALHFTLPEEEDMFWLAQNGWKYRQLVDDLDLILRAANKYDSCLLYTSEAETVAN